ncbi:MAG TPA: DUF1697 domain-containing protein [Clostridia bacterium]|nr:DUF1697 domain-containing protein [Clostridia bacterium]
MDKAIALLRGVNVGGNNMIPMPRLKEAFRKAGYSDAETYINSGNVIFSSGEEAAALQAACQGLIADAFGLDIAVAIVRGQALAEAIARAPAWWGTQSEAKHNAIFVIQPAAPEAVCASVGEIKPEYEQIAVCGSVIFWTAPLQTFSKTRWSKVVGTQAYQHITIRNANTAKKLAELATME